jgi:hypothetical protein
MEAISSEDSHVCDSELEWRRKAHAHKFEGNYSGLNKLALVHFDENS